MYTVRHITFLQGRFGRAKLNEDKNVFLPTSYLLSRTFILVGRTIVKSLWTPLEQRHSRGGQFNYVPCYYHIFPEILSMGRGLSKDLGRGGTGIMKS